MKTCKVCRGDASDRSRLPMRFRPIRGWCKSCSDTYYSARDTPYFYLKTVLALVVGFFVFMGIALGDRPQAPLVGIGFLAALVGVMALRSSRRRKRFIEANAPYMPPARIVDVDRDPELEVDRRDRDRVSES